MNVLPTIPQDADTDGHSLFDPPQRLLKHS